MKLKVNKEILEIYVYIFLMVVLSNTTFLGLKYRSVTLVISAIFMVVTVLYHSSKITKLNISKARNLLVFIGMAVLMTMSFLLSDKLLINFYLGFLLTFIEVFIMSVCYTKNQICTVYVNIMSFFSVISMVGFALIILLPGVAIALPMNVTEQGYFYTLFYTWGWDNYGWGLHLFSRNAGPFWEPGAFQGFIVLAILMILHNKDIFIKVDRKLGLLLATLITTQSTTGLVLLMILVVIFRREICSILFGGQKNWQIRLFAVSGVVVCVVLWLFSSGIITNKLAQYSDPNASTGIRLNDMLSSIKLLLIRPVFGLGYGSSLMVLLQTKVGMLGSNSNGLLLMLYSMGLPYGFIYIISSIRGIKAMFNNFDIVKMGTVCFMFLILHSTEALFTLPVYMVFLFIYDDNRKSLGGDNGKLEDFSNYSVF